MTSLSTLLFVYVLGGLTFLPLVVAVTCLCAYYTFPVVAANQPGESELRRPEDADDVFKEDDEKLQRRLANAVDVVSGIFIVTRDFQPGGVNGKPPERSSPVPTPQPSEPSIYQSMYRNLFDRKSNSSKSDVSGGTRPKRARNEFFVVLRHAHLMLYDDAEQNEVRHVIPLNLYKVSIYNDEKKKIPEGELYIRRNAIRLHTDAHDKQPFYLFSENCSLKEDFYHALLKLQARDPDDPAVPPRPLRYEQQDIISLVQRLHSSEDHLQMNWINGLLGRIFLAMYKTTEVEKFIRAKIVKKIQRVNKPNFLSDIKVGRIDVGHGAPYITNPRLKEMTADGDFCVEADVNYTGNFRLTIATKATLNLPRFKSREVDLVLAVILKRLDGHAMLKIKPPPSNRMWVTFEKMPNMELSIEPVVGQRQVVWTPILRIIEGRIREVIAETVVFPMFDDIPFTDTINQRVRGGIWAEARSRKPVPPTVPPEDVDTATAPEGPLPKAFSTSALPRQESDSAVVTGSESPGRTGSIRSTTSGKRKSGRAPSFNSMPPSAPSVSTDAVNVSATRSSETDGIDVTAPLMAIRTRSSSASSPQSTPTVPTDPPIPESPTDMPLEIPVDTPTGKSPSFSSLLDGYDSSAPASVSGTSISSMPVGSMPGGSSNSFGYTPPVSRTNTNKPLAEKPSIAAITTAAASVKKWYKNRNSISAAEGISDSNTASSSSRQRPLPPETIPAPPAAAHTKTEPINMPKRKSLPPPSVPPRRRNVLAPPLPPRRQSEIGDNLLVVAAPESEPPSPVEERFQESASSSVESPRQASEAWERDRLRAHEETEAWHAAEEAEHRTKVPWEPDEQ